MNKKKRSILLVILVLALFLVPTLGGCTKKADVTTAPTEVQTAAPTLAPTADAEVDMTKWVWAGSKDVYAVSDGKPDKPAEADIPGFHASFFTNYFKGKTNKPYLASWITCGADNIIASDEYGLDFPAGTEKLMFEAILDDVYMQPDGTYPEVNPYEETFDGWCCGNPDTAKVGFPSARVVFDRFIENVKANSPDVEIYLLTARPLFTFLTPHVGWNEWVTAYAEEKGYTLINPYDSGMTAPNGKFYEKYGDPSSPYGLGIHVNKAGAAAYADFIISEMSK